ncbi:transmembrane 9 superfamily member 2 [Citrus sinensis]|uniref:Transmembrane 9 superfamily member 2 n=1 Tax=Citrus sinensis TaxID=2711 RepID=A0ACB8N868_CITSI|nr:transmembrane 9 superfamily member 2 [Citrus sinensis]
MYYDDLLIWGFIGKVDKEWKTHPSEYKYFLYKHIQFDILYNKDRVIEISPQMDPHSLVDLTEDKEVDVDFIRRRGLPNHVKIIVFALSSLTPLLLCFIEFIIFDSIKNFTFYCQFEGMNWVRNLLLTRCFFCGPLFLTFCFLNIIAIAYSATVALPFGTIVVIVLIWTLVTSLLLMLGGIAGKNSKAEFQAPCRTTKYPREIPSLPWYRSVILHMAMAGFLPFSAIYIELYYIFAIFIYPYCMYYYYARSDMSRFMQTSFFFGSMACNCYGFFLMLGMIGFRASLLFVRHIYRSIKCE